MDIQVNLEFYASVNSGKLVEQALMVSIELIRVAILWHEQWHEGLEEASQLYFSEHNINAMLDRLEPLHKMMEKVGVSVCDCWSSPFWCFTIFSSTFLCK